MDYSQARFWFDIIQTSFTTIVIITLFIMRGRIATNVSIKELKESLRGDLEQQKLRVAKLETKIEFCPTHDDLGKIYEKLNEVIEVSAEVKGELKHLNRGFDMLRENELRKGGQA